MSQAADKEFISTGPASSFGGWSRGNQTQALFPLAAGRATDLAWAAELCPNRAIGKSQRAVKRGRAPLGIPQVRPAGLTFWGVGRHSLS